MAERVQSDNVREINPNFPIPEGLTIFSYEETLDVDEFELETITGDFAEVGEVIVDDSDIDADADNTLPTPIIFGVAEQTIRTAPDGSQVVDVVLDVQDINASAKYNIRIAAQ